MLKSKQDIIDILNGLNINYFDIDVGRVNFANHPTTKKGESCLSYEPAMVWL